MLAAAVASLHSVRLSAERCSVERNAEHGPVSCQQHVMEFLLSTAQWCHLRPAAYAYAFLAGSLATFSALSDLGFVHALSAAHKHPTGMGDVTCWWAVHASDAGGYLLGTSPAAVHMSNEFARDDVA